jgi:hypothetical protein
MSKQIKLKDISLHLYLEFNDITSKVSLRFSPRQTGNRSIYLANVNEKLLRYQRWEENMDPSSLGHKSPQDVALRLIKEAYQDLPFLREVDKVIIHTSGLSLFHIAEAIESLSKRELDLRNIRVR